jgi:2-C-methyl-D-erythritol 4-phosphate cytidylyltransferase
VPKGCDVVLVHDAARPFAPPSMIARVEAAVRGGALAVVPGLAVADTIKAVDGSGIVTGTPDRMTLRAVQTPQGFARDLLERAHAAGAAAILAGGAPATDDAALVEALGEPVLVVKGDPAAAKITTPNDLIKADVGRAMRAEARAQRPASVASTSERRPPMRG